MPHGVNNRTRRRRKHRRQQYQRNHRRQRCQRGGLLYGENLLELLKANEHIPMDEGEKIIRLLLLVTGGAKLVCDSSTFSFIFELTLKDKYSFIDPFRGQSGARTGRDVSKYCAKISFVSKTQKKYVFGNIEKSTTLPSDATKEAYTQKRLFDTFACASFVPAVIAHSILTIQAFEEIFGTLLSGSDTFKSFKWIKTWIESDPEIGVNVILMEMVDYKRTKPGDPIIHDDTTKFRMMNYDVASMRIEIASMRIASGLAISAGKGDVHYDCHKGNGMATLDGSQVYILDWGGTYYLKNEEDRTELIDLFIELCDGGKVTRDEEEKRSMLLQQAKSSHKPITEKDILRTRFPCLEDICKFFNFDPTGMTTDDVGISKEEKQKQVKEILKVEFTKRINFVDFTTTPIDIEKLHCTLMMIAFIDFMVHIVNYTMPVCQCRHIMTVVYAAVVPVQIRGESGIFRVFDDFRTFLNIFNIANAPRDETRLNQIADFIRETVEQCTLTKARASRRAPTKAPVLSVSKAHAPSSALTSSASRRASTPAPSRALMSSAPTKVSAPSRASTPAPSRASTPAPSRASRRVGR